MSPAPACPGDFDASHVRAEITPIAQAADDAIIHWSETGRPWQLAIDTGMSRAGVQWNEIESLRETLVAHPPEGVFTHFHSAEQSDGSREQQEERFDRAIGALPARPAMVHAENSAAVEHRGRSRWSVVRPGVFLYGVMSGNSPQIKPEPVVSLRARVVDIRTIADGESVGYGATYRADGARRVATLAIGYADGYHRVLGNRAQVLVNGARVSVVGVVTMDMTVVDVTHAECAIGDMATLIGTDGDESITVNDLAAFGELSPYEVLTSLRGRLPRRYIEDANE